LQVVTSLRGPLREPERRDKWEKKLKVKSLCGTQERKGPLVCYLMTSKGGRTPKMAAILTGEGSQQLPTYKSSFRTQQDVLSKDTKLCRLTGCVMVRRNSRGEGEVALHGPTGIFYTTLAERDVRRGKKMGGGQPPGVGKCPTEKSWSGTELLAHELPSSWGKTPGYWVASLNGQ